MVASHIARSGPLRSVRVSSRAHPERAPAATGPGAPRVPAGFRVLSELGRGGMGVVHKARHLKTSTNIDAINMFFGAVTEALKHRHEERSAAYSRSGALGNYAVTKRSLAVSFNPTM